MVSDLGLERAAREQGLSSPDEPFLTYTLREMFEAIRADLGQIESKLDRKADKEDLVRLEHQLETVKREADERGNSAALTVDRVAADAQRRHDDHTSRLEDLEKWRAKVIGIAIGVGSVSGGAASVIAKALGS